MCHQPETSPPEGARWARTPHCCDDVTNVATVKPGLCVKFRRVNQRWRRNASQANCSETRLAKLPGVHTCGAIT